MNRARWIGLLAGVALCVILLGNVTAQSPGPLPHDPALARTEGEAPVSPAGPSGVALGAAFSYQGQLKLNGVLVNDDCDMAFRLYDAYTLGNQVGDAISTTLAVHNGLFTLAPMAFGTDAFKGDTRWLEIRVRCPSGAGTYEKLTPRQQLWAAPYALTLRPGATISATMTGNLLSLENHSTSGGRAAYFRNDGGGSYAAVRVDNQGDSWGVYASSQGGSGVYGESTTGHGVSGYSASSYGIYGESPSSRGVYGKSDNDVGVYAYSNGTGISNPALFAINSHTGVSEPNGIAIYAENASVDTTIVANNTGTGDTFRGIRTDAHRGVYFRVTYTGAVEAANVFVRGGGDVVEQFKISAPEKPEPGTLMVIDEDHPGQLKMSTVAYDYKVAGIVSGAGGVQPGMVLQQPGVLDGDTPIAMLGRVYVKADAKYGRIKPGDLLTTSDTPGYAMRAADIARAQGAIIGKAMTGLDAGTGLVLVLVNLQ